MNVALVIPSVLVARGFESVFTDMGEFRVSGVLSDLSNSAESGMKLAGADVIVVDPMVFEYAVRSNVRSVLSRYSDAAVVGLQTVNMSDEALKQYDEVVNIYDAPPVIIRKLRSAVSARSDAPKQDGEELSAREKEILVCVARGMLNKEIADYYNISVYTVITHRKNITRKTGIKTVAGLTVYALLNNLIDYSSIE
ncbi:MAG: response regulator transcription factor [Bacteroidetes bacterium]|uniref:Response regulator transcription factor n=1 Tax=Candidatus Cryptobacteroides intestinavium TaxID=2840766 RepID=A0A9D9HIE1_9BACT|nr:response regulator transcription factor [Candidatus Cryptobacteroides intestinavium]